MSQDQKQIKASINELANLERKCDAEIRFKEETRRMILQCKKRLEGLLLSPSAPRGKQSERAIAAADEARAKYLLKRIKKTA